MGDEEKNEGLRTRALEIMHDPDLALFADEDLKELINGYATLPLEARKEADEVIKEFVSMVEEYQKVDKRQKAV